MKSGVEQERRKFYDSSDAGEVTQNSSRVLASERLAGGERSRTAAGEMWKCKWRAG